MQQCIANAKTGNKGVVNQTPSCNTSNVGATQAINSQPIQDTLEKTGAKEIAKNGKNVKKYIAIGAAVAGAIAIGAVALTSLIKKVNCSK